jgi:hypothetical protein
MSATTAEQIPTVDALARLSAGSYEAMIADLNSQIAKQAEELFGAQCQAHLVATFNGYALAESAGRVVRFQYERDDAGVKISNIQETTVRRVPRGEFIAESAKKIVDALLLDQLDEATEAAAALVPILGERFEIVPTPALADKLIDRLVAETPWKDFYVEGLPLFSKVLGEELTAIEVARLEPKFSRIYESPSDEQSREYAELVHSDVVLVRDRIAEAAKVISGSYAKLEQQTEMVAEDKKVLLNFATDLKNDVDDVLSLFQEAVEQITETTVLGKLFDTSVATLRQYEIAAAFLNKVSAGEA